MKYLDLSGLVKYSDKVKELLDNKANKDIITKICNELSRIVSLNKTLYFIAGNGFDDADIEFIYNLNNKEYAVNIPSNDIIQINVKEDISFISFEDNCIDTLDISKLDTSNVINMSGMFAYCSELKTLDLSNFDTSNVTNMDGMFAGCSSLISLNLSNFDTSNVKCMSMMFAGCSSLISLNLSNFIVNPNESVDFTMMFARCNKLESLDLSNFEVDNNRYYDHMFIFEESENIRYIKCKLSFKDWCIENQDEIRLPYNMREIGSGIWDIVD